MSPKVPKAYLDARRAEILDAAARCFMEKGFQNTTMQDIYQATSLSPGAVYNYFESKEDIINAAAKTSQERNSAMIASAASGNPDKALSNVGRLFLSFARQVDLVNTASVDFALYAEASRNPQIREALRKGQDAVMTKIIELVKYNQRKGIFNNKLDAGAISRILISIFLGIEVHKTLDPDFNLDAYGKVLEAVLNGSLFKANPKSRRMPGPGSKRAPAERKVKNDAPGKRS